MAHSTQSLYERVMARTVVQDGGCWTWMGAKAHGHGQLSVDGRRLYVHRIVYEALVGPIPDGLQIDHLCRNRACVNPTHLEPVTPTENVLRGESPAAVAYRRVKATGTCQRGHSMTDPANIFLTRKGKPECRACRRLWRQEGEARRPKRHRVRPCRYHGCDKCSVCLAGQCCGNDR